MATEYSGTADPARSLALLWRTHERSSRKGKPDLSVDRIVAAAIEIADTEGLAALSMRRVADRLGVGTMSLYTYVPAKAELVDVMLDTVYAETARPADVPGGWRARLELIARENRELYRRHPWTLQVAAANRPVLGPNLMAKYEYELQAVAGIGLTEIEMDFVINLVASYVQGATHGAVAADRSQQGSGMSDEQWWRAHAPLFGRLFDPERYPTAAAVGTAVGESQGSAYDPDANFEFGLARLLDGIEALLASRPAP
ncbi:TetR/AcrR family transcriptional regulator [Marinactinospora rubrisoli]|uniref:TetR/AcrR family transcriptional regulator n=1 Tax=Marinactinospora rubrisoli TaxID=2715399 RepID=A0ABW2KNF6_9ACTN